jgi:hypothetical protein
MRRTGITSLAKVNELKKYVGLIPVALFALLLGCGGGGGGGSSTNGTTNASTTGFTSGQTNAQAGDTILGQLVRGGTPIPNTTVRFYDNSNVFLASDVTNVDGYFSTAVGTNATRMDVDGQPMVGIHYVSFVYNSLVFQASTTNPSFTCKVPLPAITPGVLTPMPGGQFQFFVDSSPPPPPPTGCIP